MNKAIFALVFCALSVPAVAADFPTFTSVRPVLPQPGMGFPPTTIYSPQPAQVAQAPNVVNNYYDIDIWNIDQSTHNTQQFVQGDQNFGGFTYNQQGFVFNPSMFGVWHQRPSNETFDWYMANILGNPYPFRASSQLVDLNGDGLVDYVYTASIQNGQTIVSTWVQSPMGYRVINELW